MSAGFTDSSWVTSGGRKSRKTGDKMHEVYCRTVPGGCDPQVIRTETGVVISWDDGKGRREVRRLPANAIVTWENGVFRVSFGQRAEPVRCSPGAWA